jgi:hypothetical protein
MLQKLEADVRQHIRIEQQLKLHIESIQEKIEEDEKVIEDYSHQKERFQRERARMDEMLTLREKEINKLEKQLKFVNKSLGERDVLVGNLEKELEQTKNSLNKERYIFENERKALVRFNKSSEEIRAYSRSNERTETLKGKFITVKFIIAVNNNMSQTALPKKPVSRMYASLYTSNQTKNKSDNVQNSKDYEKLYKDFMKNKKPDVKELLESNRTLVNAPVPSSLATKNCDFRSESSRKCKQNKSKRKDVKESGQKHLPKSKRKQILENSKSKDRKLESKIDFYRNRAMAEKNGIHHRTYDGHDKENACINYAQSTSERDPNMR